MYHFRGEYIPKLTRDHTLRKERRYVDSLSDDDLEISFQAKDRSISDTLNYILGLSLDRGSTDNVTGILIRIMGD